MDHLLRWLLPTYLVVFLGLAFGWRSYLVWRTTGINPFVLGISDNVYDFIGRLFKVTLLGCGIVVLVYALSPEGYGFLGPISWLNISTLQIIGIALLAVSLVWVLIAQAQMGTSWRVGIDSEHETPLVMHGIFRVSRNPIFLGMRVTLLGLFLILPSAASLAILMVGDVLMQIQVRLEEEHLTKMHGESYQAYTKQTRRWL
jgi:protein-S-isoprenylcysteine O-methyltransferase Ste14